MEGGGELEEQRLAAFSITKPDTIYYCNLNTFGLKSSHLTSDTKVKNTTYLHALCNIRKENRETSEEENSNPRCVKILVFFPTLRTLLKHQHKCEVTQEL